MDKLYGGHIVARYLKDIEGVDTVFSLSGDHITRIYDGFLEWNIRLIDVRHEQAAVMAAHSWSLYSGKPGVCMLTAGPGFTNGISGIVNAFLDNIPLVILAGGAPIAERDKGDLQEIKQEEIIASYTKWKGTCLDIKRIPEYLSTAFRQAVSGRPGPVFLELPVDIVESSVDSSKIVFPAGGSRRYGSRPDAESIDKAVELINQAQRPLVLGGSGVHHSQCRKELTSFIDKTGIPIILNNAGRGVIPDSHPLNLMGIHMGASMIAVPQADVIIALGTRFNWISGFGQMMPAAKIIRVDIDAGEIDRNRKADVGLVGDVRLTLQELNSRVDAKKHTDWFDHLEKSSAVFVEMEKPQKETSSDPIHPVRLVEQIRKCIGDDALFLTDGGDSGAFGQLGFKATEPASVLNTASELFGCIGGGTPFAIGAKVARPEKQVVLFTGDGSFGFNGMEFDTAVRHNIPLLCVICNDQQWGMIKHLQDMKCGPERTIGCVLGMVHYEKVVEALGGHGELVTKDHEIAPAIKRALASGKPACINVLVDSSAISGATMILHQKLSFS